MKAVLRWWQPILLAAAVVFADDYDSVPGLQHGQPLFEVPLTVGGEENASYSLVVKVGDRINQVAKQWCIENNARSSEVSSCCAPGSVLVTSANLSRQVELVAAEIRRRLQEFEHKPRLLNSFKSAPNRTTTLPKQPLRPGLPPNSYLFTIPIKWGLAEDTCATLPLYVSVTTACV